MEEFLDTVPAGCRVLICEDEGLTRLRLSISLRSLGYDVVGDACDGEDAVVKARTLRPDLILMDVNMPRMDGVEATARIMEEAPTPIVMLTAYGEPAMVRRALEAGASGYLVKPIRDEQLAPAIAVARAHFEHVQEAAQGELAAEESGRALTARAEAAEQRAQDLAGRLNREREAARILAESLLGRPPRLAGYQFATRYEPAVRAALIGGDYFDFIPLAEGRLGIVIGDACGKGAAAAAFMAKVKYMLRAYALEDCTPATAFTRLNHTLCGEEEDADAFITMFFAVLDPKTGRLTWANAGHPPPLLCSSRTGRCETLMPTGGLLGAFEETTYGQETTLLEPGCRLTLYTDGVSEARSGGVMLGEDGVEQVLRECGPQEAAAVADQLMERARDAAGGELQDDAAVVVLGME